jgi:hypothetical protein
LRRAQEAKAERDAERALRERQIEIALADYYETTARAQRLRAEANRRAEGILGDAERTVAEPLTAARDAVCRLRELLGGVTEVAALCGLTVSTVREMLASDAGSPARETAAGDER